MIPKYIRPKTPVYNKGVLVIQIDDGKIGDYTHWLPLALREASKFSSWVNIPTVVMNPAINTANIGKTGFVSLNNLKEEESHGWEILSHGRHHEGIGEYPLIKNANAGETFLEIEGAKQVAIFDEGGAYRYRIFEGAKEEEIKILTKTGAQAGAGSLTISSPLLNSYTTAARIQLTEQSAYDLLQGCIDDAAVWGIDLKHHVYTYHGGGDRFSSQNSERWMSQYFVSGRGASINDGMNNPITANLNRMNAGLNTNTSKVRVDEMLDGMTTSDNLLIYYGHGEKDQVNLDKLTHLIHGALRRGIRIMTMSGALEYYGVTNS